MGEHHCTVCTILSREWWRGGAGFDGPQIMSFLRVCQQLSPGQFGGARSEARCEAETLFFFSVAFTVLLGAGCGPKFLEQIP